MSKWEARQRTPGDPEWIIFDGPLASVAERIYVESNARLIAAAPDMAELLERLVESNKATGPTTFMQEAMREADDARALLERIKGEA